MNYTKKNVNVGCIHEKNVASNISFHLPMCDSDNHRHPALCYSFWKLIKQDNSTNKRIYLLHAKGCWATDPNLCQTKLFNNSLLFCCCKGELCNRDLNPEICYEEFNNRNSKKLNSLSNVEINLSNDSINLVFLIALITILITIIYLIGLIVRTNKERRLIKKSLPKNNQINFEDKRFDWKKESEKLLINHDDIELIEYKARGRYGDLYLGQMMNRTQLAVKIFQQIDYESFKNELKIYKLPGLKHENILTFLKAEVKLDSLTKTPEYWLITEYQENGCLQEYLTGNLLNEKQIAQICLDIANGLAFLHGYGRCNRQIAHRDFKSNNILLNDKLRACIADFGLALVFYNHKLQSDTLNQVGTSRYFSPELLDGAINFSGDSLLKADVYACALVFWECLSRCNSLQELNEIKEYKLPFELELGNMPSINELRNCVSIKKRRPIIEKHWKSTEFSSNFCRTIEDCWGHDAESRLTASCIAERLKILKNLVDPE